MPALHKALGGTSLVMEFVRVGTISNATILIFHFEKILIHSFSKHLLSTHLCTRHVLNNRDTKKHGRNFILNSGVLRYVFT